MPLIDAHPFTTAQAVYDRIVYGEGREATPRMMVGQLLEPAVLDLGRKLLGLPLRACSRPYVHPTLPLCASLDAYAGPGELAEVKVTSAWVGDNPASYVLAQVQTQLLLSRRSRAHLLVLAGSSFTDTVLEADPVAQAIILEAVRDFTDRFLVPGIRPPSKPLIFSAYGGTSTLGVSRHVR